MVGRPERRGDRVAIAGDYQFRALTDGPVVQRFWHRSKLVAIDRHLPPQPGDRVLDLGCGSGVVADHLTTASADVTTIDGNAEAIRFASMRFGPPNLTLRTGLLEDLALPAATLDRVYRLEMIEHLYRHQIHELLVNVRQILRPGGCLLLTTPNYRSPWHVVRHPA